MTEHKIKGEKQRGCDRKRAGWRLEKERKNVKEK